MRYPIGERATFPEAIDAANEAANMTGIRYRVSVSGGRFEFTPVDTPNRELHMPVRV